MHGWHGAHDGASLIAGVDRPCRIVNIVASFFLGARDINIERVCSVAAARSRVAIFFDPRGFKVSATIVLLHPRATLRVSSTGSVIVTGATDEGTARLAGHILAGWLRRDVGIVTARVQRFSICNIVATVALPEGQLLRLDDMLQHMGAEARYVPDLFPGLTLRDRARGVTCLFFRSGHINVMGQKTREGIAAGAQHALDVARQFIDSESSTVHHTQYRYERRAARASAADAALRECLTTEPSSTSSSP
jgi:TATA-box binding protein (TBP) (component of TFIID and TFIIIB)